MTPIRVILFTIFFTALEAKRSVSKPLACPKPCAYTARCTPYASSANDLVWATGDGICKVIANGCMFGLEQCERQNACLPPMVAMDKVKCQQSCASGCDALSASPVCAWFPSTSSTGTKNEQYIEFKNKCELNRWSCLNEKPYVTSSLENCQQSTSQLLEKQN